MANITYRDIVRALHELELNQTNDVVAHVSLSSLGDVRGGAETVIGALLATCGTVVMPAFTHQTTVWPASGPADNGCVYSDHTAENARAAMFSPDLPVDPDLGQVAEAFRRHPQAKRSHHPVLSFAAAGVHAEEILATQTLQDPLGPLDWLYDRHGDVLLMGVDHRANVTLHLAEKFAGRKQFVRWALTPRRVVECPGFPGCSDGFNAIGPRLAYTVRQEWAGQAQLQAVPIFNLVGVTQDWLEANPLALLCNHSYCERCRAIRTEFARFAQKH